jgi:hypothetical protein
MAERVGSYDRAQAMLVEGAVVEQALQSTGEITETDMVKLDESVSVLCLLPVPQSYTLNTC